MFHGLRVLIALAVLSWVSLGALVAVFLKIALRPDAGFGAVGQGALRRKLPPRLACRPSPSRPGTSPGGLRPHALRETRAAAGVRAGRSRRARPLRMPRSDRKRRARRGRLRGRT